MFIEKSAKVWLNGATGITDPVRVSQYDTGWRFVFTVYSSDSSLYFPSTTPSVVLEGRKSDGTVFAVPGSFENGNAIIDCESQITSATGEVICELRISESQKTVGTANFKIIVEEAPLSGYIASEDDFSSMKQIIDEVNEAGSIALSAASAAQISAQNAEISAQTASVQAGMAYKIARTVSEMIDRDIGYVYVGREPGYNYGGWYYWNGTSWVLGGTATDNTLTVAGAAADAAACGAVRDELQRYNSYDLLPLARDLYPYGRTVTRNGVTYTWDEGYTHCHITGTRTGTTLYSIFEYATNPHLMDGIVQGETYYASYDVAYTLPTKAWLSVGFTDSEAALIINRYLGDGDSFTVPANAAGMYLRVCVVSDTEVDCVMSKIQIKTALSNKELEAKIDEVSTQTAAADAKASEAKAETSKLQAALLAHNCADVLAYSKPYKDGLSKTSNGITYAWDNNYTSCHITGTRTSTTLYNIFNATTAGNLALMDGVTTGNTYHVTYDVAYTLPTIALLEVNFCDSSAAWITDASKYLSSGDSFVVPNNAAGMYLRVRVTASTEADCVMSNIQVKNTLSNKELEAAIHAVTPTVKPLGKWMVSVIDDDTTNDTYVTQFHDNCEHMGIVGSYAVMTGRIEDGSTSLSKLLGYEDEGFGMLIHCYHQSGAADWGNPPYRNLDNCRANLAKGLRQMREYGFTNYNLWVTPGGHHDADFEHLARYFGAGCLISTASATYNKITDNNRYWIKRIMLTPSDSDSGGRYAMSVLKGYVDAFTADEKGGWLLINTHYNENGWSGQWDATEDSDGYPVGYSRFNELVQYCKDKGCTFMSTQEAWSYYGPYLAYNEVRGA